MYKTIIINSKPEAIAHLKYAISESNLGFTVVSSYLYNKRASDAVARTRPNLVITDLPPSKEKNLDIVKNIHSRFPDIKILLYTDRTDFALAKNAVAQGVSGIVCPGDDSELTAALTGIKGLLDRQVIQKKRDKLFE